MKILAFSYQAPREIIPILVDFITLLFFLIVEYSLVVIIAADLLLSPSLSDFPTTFYQKNVYFV
jgi:hypothetical protein